MGADVNRVSAYEAMWHPDIPSDVRLDERNLDILGDYLKKFPNEALEIKSGLVNANDKGNWLELLRLEDIAISANLTNKGKESVSFTFLEDVEWSNKYIEDIIEQLKEIRKDFPDSDFGRWDFIEGTNIMKKFETHQDLKSSLSNNKTSDGDILIVAENTADIVNHEFGHRITEPLDSEAEAAHSLLMMFSPDQVGNLSLSLIHI